ncbi:MAG: hypothetical protein AAF399_06330 [Bacteroidota bacterium]
MTYFNLLECIATVLHFLALDQPEEGLEHLQVWAFEQQMPMEWHWELLVLQADYRRLPEEILPQAQAVQLLFRLLGLLYRLQEVE